MKAVKIRTFVLLQVVPHWRCFGSLVMSTERQTSDIKLPGSNLLHLKQCSSDILVQCRCPIVHVHATYHRACAVHRVPPVPVVQFSKVYIDCTVKLQIQGPMEWEFYYLFSYLANCLLIGYFKFKTLP